MGGSRGRWHSSGGGGWRGRGQLGWHYAMLKYLSCVCVCKEIIGH